MQGTALAVLLSVLPMAGAAAPVPPREHPRLFLRAADVAALRQKLSSPAMRQVRASLLLDSNLPGATFDEQRRCFEANALFYVLQIDTVTWTALPAGKTVFGRKAVDTALVALSTATFLEDYDGYNAAGRAQTGGAMVYDWCYGLMTPAERDRLRASLERLAAQEAEYPYPPDPVTRVWGAVTGHASENVILRDLLAAGIAIYDEDPTMYDWAAGRFFTYYVPARNFFYPSHTHYQGDSYGPTRFQYEIFAAWIFRRMGAGDVFSAEQGKVPYRWIYARRPDGQLLRDGDCSLSAGEIGRWWTPWRNISTMAAAAYCRDPYLQSQPGSYEPIWQALFEDVELSSRPVSELPLTRYFDPPAGIMMARTGWDTAVDFNSRTVVAEMKIKEWQTNNHQHLDAGAFQIYYRGALAIDSGIYGGVTGRYGCDHDINYHKRTVAHNCLLVYDPAEGVQSYGNQVQNDGGQRWPNQGREPQTLNELLTKGYRSGRVLHHAFGPDPVAPEFSYLKGDIAPAYSGKIRNYQRSFVFLNLKNDQHPAALIVHDAVTSTNANFRKYWLLHAIEEPEVSGDIVTVRRTGTMYNAAGRAVGKYNGKLVNRTLLPAAGNLSIVKVGGSGHEFDVFGSTHPNGPASSTTSEEPGSWRLEICPVASSATDQFLNVMQVMDNDGPVPLEIAGIDTSALCGTRIADRVVTFARGYEPLSGSVTFSVPGTGTCSFLVTDLIAGRWKIEAGSGATTAMVTVDGETGIAFFRAPAGTCTLTCVEAGAKTLAAPRGLRTR